MSPGTSEGGEYQERDDELVDGLRAEDPQQQRNAMVKLLKVLKKPFLASLRKWARAYPSSALADALKARELKDIYQQTMTCIWRRRRKLKKGKSLLSLLITIARRRAVDRRRKLRKEEVDARIEAEVRQTETTGKLPQSFWDDLKLFLRSLSWRDKIVLRLDVELKERGDRGTAAELVAILRDRHPDETWEIGAVSKQRTRLREKFRKFLESQGYNIPKKRGHDV